MDRIVQRVEFGNANPIKKKRVAAYARVSSEKDTMLHSLAAQVSYFSDLIQRNPEWIYCGVYSDEGISGTKEEREGFQQMLADCKAGKIDLIIAKSISRFARNTVVLLETVRELKLINVDVFFEEQRINTMSAEGELLITLLASFAQEESRSVSENMKWRIRKNFEEGMPWAGTVLGYRIQDGHYVVVPEEAEIVKEIFSLYLSGYGRTYIAKKMNEKELKTRIGNNFRPNSITRTLQNYNYTGNLLLQKTFMESHMAKYSTVNVGQLTRYQAFNTHEAIISEEDFNAVQNEIVRRKEVFAAKGKTTNRYPFTKLIRCDKCGKYYQRKTTATGVVWICSTYNVFGKSACASKQIPEKTLEAVLGKYNLSDISEIVACDGNRLKIRLKDGVEAIETWKDRSRSESWTAEKRAEARKRKMERSTYHGESTSHTGNY